MPTDPFQWLASLPPQYLWWGAGGILFIVELVLPGSFLIWIGVAALLTGFTALQIAETDTLFILFGLYSLFTCWIGKKLYIHFNLMESEDPSLNERGGSLVGRRLILSDAIVNGEGRIKIDDSTWKAKGPDLPVDTLVTIAGIDGITLLVEPVSKEAQRSRKSSDSSETNPE